MNTQNITDGMVAMADRMASNIHRAYCSTDGRRVVSATHTGATSNCPDLASETARDAFVRNVFCPALNRKLDAGETGVTCSFFRFETSYNPETDTLRIAADPQYSRR